MFDRLKSFLQEAGWRGVLLGLALSVVASPFLAQIVTPLFVAGGAPGFQKPLVKASVMQSGPNYDSGDVIEEYGNLTWKPDYDVYRVFLRNEEGPTMRNIRMHIRFPGCAVGYKPSGIGVRGDFNLDVPLEGEVTLSDPELARTIDGASCTIFIEADQLAEDETIMTEFVVEHQPERCDILLAYNPNRKFIVEYSWNAQGQRRDEARPGRITGADPEFEKVSTIVENSTQAWSSASEVYDEPRKVYIYGVTAESGEAAAEKCFGG